MIEKEKYRNDIKEEFSEKQFRRIGK